MHLISGNASFPDLFATVQARAFHLETRDDYLSASENESLTRFRADESTDVGGDWFANWSNLIRETTARGIAVQRVRIVTEPHTLYTRYLLALAKYNTAAGEDIRYLPRRNADPADSRSEDFWVLDDDRVAFSVFDENEYWIGAALTDDPTIVAYACSIRDRVWTVATRYEEYVRT
ncbi:hypothetical protein BJY24_003995 [Nocardia transvalensis]|uniref:DUF6879 domain-containing protein n=1 Tax=Nocardia transvalensis TaxID=37333 RepID=A0A7W9PGD8_9NOCA|nr:DUF6879 family protein [Nocardia transvalensis]MBB5915128.1 hypothetical protein [Nocardia transvalensis]